MDICKLLLSNKDAKYKEFQSKLIPTVEPSRIIGVRIPTIRKMARSIPEENAKAFLSGLPHRYYDEYNLHAFLIERIKDFDECVKRVDELLPYIDNWATCDSMMPRAFGGEEKRLLPHIMRWLASGHTYTVRYGIVLLMKLYLGENFEMWQMDLVAERCCDEYYVNMAVAWYFATAMVTRWDMALEYIEGGKLSRAVSQMTVRKACDSFRITKEKKVYLKSLKL